MAKNAQFIYGGGGDVTLYDATNGWYHLGYLSELKLTGTPSTVQTGHGQLAQFLMIYKLEARALQSNAALITELNDRRTVEQTIYIVGGGRLYTLTGMLIGYGPQLPFNTSEPSTIMVSAQSVVEPSWAENLLGSYGTFETDTNTDGICDGWNDDSNTAYSQESTFLGSGGGSYCQQVEFAEGSSLISNVITCPVQSPIKLTFSATIYAVENINLYLKLIPYNTSDVAQSEVNSTVFQMTATNETRQSYTFVYTPSVLIKGFAVAIYHDDASDPVAQIDNAQLEIGGLRDFRDE